MQLSMNPEQPGVVHLPVMVVAEVQDSLLVVMNDLQRLEGLLSHASDVLMERFHDAIQVLDAEAEPSTNVERARGDLHVAVTELQFQDMASQLIVHTSKILKACAHQLAAETMGVDEDEDVTSQDELMMRPPDRPNPVTQDEMDAGSIELF